MPGAGSGRGCGLGGVGEVGAQVVEVDAERLRDADGDAWRRVAVAAFDVAQVGPVDADLAGEFCDR